MDMRKLVGRNVGRIRREKGLTQERLAEISGFSQRYISDLEQGRRNPTVVTLYELATALGVNHLDLLRPNQEGVGPRMWWLGADRPRASIVPFSNGSDPATRIDT